MQTWIAKRPTLSFYLLTLLAQGLRVAPGSGVTHFPRLLGSLLTAMAVTAVLGRRKGPHELFGRMFRLGPHRLLLAQGRARAAVWVAQVYLATGHGVLCVALWHAAHNMMVARKIGAGLPAAIVGTAVMAWGVILAVRWWRRS